MADVRFNRPPYAFPETTPAYASRNVRPVGDRGCGSGSLLVSDDSHAWHAGGFFIVDDFDPEAFLAVLRTMEAEERAEMGWLGRWPIWEIQRWAEQNPRLAEKAGVTIVIVSGVTVGVLWHVMSPHLTWLWPIVHGVVSFVWSVVRPAR